MGCGCIESSVQKMGSGLVNPKDSKAIASTRTHVYFR